MFVAQTTHRIAHFDALYCVVISRSSRRVFFSFSLAPSPSPSPSPSSSPSRSLSASSTALGVSSEIGLGARESFVPRARRSYRTPLRQRARDLLARDRRALHRPALAPLRQVPRALHPGVVLRSARLRAATRISSIEMRASGSRQRNFRSRSLSLRPPRGQRGYTSGAESEAGYSISFSTRSSKNATMSGLYSGKRPTTMMYSVTPTAQIYSQRRSAALRPPRTCCTPSRSCSRAGRSRCSPLCCLIIRSANA